LQKGKTTQRGESSSRTNAMQSWNGRHKNGVASVFDHTADNLTGFTWGKLLLIAAVSVHFATLLALSQDLYNIITEQCDFQTKPA